MSKPTCAVNVVFNVKREFADQFLEAVLLQAKNSLELEPWCHQFDVCTVDDNPCVILLYETYDDRAAFGKHRESEHLSNFNSTIGDWVISREVTIWDIAPVT